MVTEDLGAMNKEDNKKWQNILEKYPEANFLQSPEYGRMNEILGCKVVIDDFEGLGWALMIVRNAKRGRYLEIPCGPLIDWNDKVARKNVLAQIAKIGKAEKCVFVRMRPQLTTTDENLKILENLGMKKSPMHLAAEHTVMLDLTKSLDAILADMRRQTRYEVRQSEKIGIEVTSSDSVEIFKNFHTCQVETAKRQGFVPPSLDVLMAEREAFAGNIRIYTASAPKNNNATFVAKYPDIENGALIAYGMIIGGGKEADYYEAASTLLNRRVPGAYALLWQAIKDLKEAGYERFNLWGIAPPGQTQHRYAGVTTFKTGFGGEVVEFVPAHDLILSRIGYLKDYVVETARKKKRHL